MKCEVEWEKTPQYSIQEVDDGTVVVEISLPDVSKENIQLNLEQRRLSLKAIIDERKEEEESADKEEVPSIEAEPKEEEQEQGIVIIDEDEEAEQQQEMTSNEGSTELLQEPSSKTKCETKGKYSLSLALPKTIVTERIEAKFEQEKLTIHLPALPSLHSREIQVQ